MIYLKIKGIFFELFLQYRNTDEAKAILFFVLGVFICIIFPYLLGSLNASIITSKYLYNDDIRNYGSGNAGLTNMHRVYGKKAAVYTLVGDISKQIISVLLGMFAFGVNGAFLAGTFCVLGHIAPIFYRFKGGKGVLTAAAMVLLIDPIIFLILILAFIITVLISRYISMGSMVAGFLYPALVFYRDKLFYGTTPSLPAMLFSVFIGLLIIFTHRENMKRIYRNEESRFSFKKKPLNEYKSKKRNKK